MNYAELAKHIEEKLDGKVPAKTLLEIISGYVNSESGTPDGAETIVYLADGCTLRSGVYEETSDSLMCGEYVRICEPDGDEVVYWDANEWEEDPVLVMGAIMRAASGTRLQR